ncbi:hypothetical protein M8494_11765 [Serratia ureilytica]
MQIETILAGGSFGRRIDLSNRRCGAGSGGPTWRRRPRYRPRPRREGGMDARRHPQRLVAPDDPAPPARRHSRRQGGGWTATVVGHSWTRHSAMDALVVGGLDQDDGRGRQRSVITSKPSAAMRIVPGKVPTTCAVGRQHPPATRWRAFIDQLLQETGQDRSKGGWR